MEIEIRLMVKSKTVRVISDTVQSSVHLFFFFLSLSLANAILLNPLSLLHLRCSFGRRFTAYVSAACKHKTNEWMRARARAKSIDRMRTRVNRTRMNEWQWCSISNRQEGVFLPSLSFALPCVYFLPVIHTRILRCIYILAILHIEYTCRHRNGHVNNTYERVHRCTSCESIDDFSRVLWIHAVTDI